MSFFFGVEGFIWIFLRKFKVFNNFSKPSLQKNNFTMRIQGPNLTFLGMIWLSLLTFRTLHLMLPLYSNEIRIKINLAKLDPSFFVHFLTCRLFMVCMIKFCGVGWNSCLSRSALVTFCGLEYLIWWLDGILAWASWIRGSKNSL